MLRSSAVWHLIARVVLAAVVSIVVALGLAWLTERVPVLGIVVTVLALALIGWGVWQALHADERWRRLMLMGGTYAAALLVVVALNLLFRPDASASTELADDASTSTDASATSSPITPATSVATVPTVPATSDPTPTTVPAGPATSEPAPTTDPVPTTAALPTTAAVPAVAITVDDPAGDCDCADDLTGIGVTADGAGIRVDVATSGAASPVWLWSLSEPGRPLVLGGERFEERAGGWSASVDDAPAGPWAIVSAGGDRVPDLGFVDGDGAITSVSGDGALAAQLEADLAAAQAGAPLLGAAEAQLVTSLIARQLTTSTQVYDRRLDTQPGVAIVTEIVVDWPRLAQRVVLDGEVIQYFVVTADGAQLCTPPDGGDGPYDCAATASPLPVNSAAAIVADPAALTVGELTSSAHLDRPTTCLTIDATPDGGPSVGETCWFDDGTQATATRTGVDTLSLLDTTPTVDAAQLDPSAPTLLSPSAIAAGAG